MTCSSISKRRRTADCRFRLHATEAAAAIDTRSCFRDSPKSRGPYLGVHIRHTDYRSDYHPVIGRIAAAPVAKVFLATDNQHILDEFRASLPGKQIFSFAEELSVDGTPIHLSRLQRR